MKGSNAGTLLALWQQGQSDVKGVRTVHTKATAGTERWPMIHEAEHEARERSAREIRKARRKAFIVSARAAARGKRVKKK